MTLPAPDQRALGPYGVAREVALMLPQHPGETAQGLYRLYLDRFAALNCERNNASHMIAQHLRALEESGQVIGERSGKTSPLKWTWIGGAPLTAAPSVHATSPEHPPTPEAPAPSAEPPPAAAAPIDHTAETNRATALDESDPFDAALLELKRQFLAQTRRPIARVEEKRQTLASLSQFLSEDIATLLLEIAEDLS